MLWRVRTTMPDRPGALARLARSCGEREVNILAVQVFPGVERVTDELVLSVPANWRLVDVAELVEEAGGVAVSAGPCTEQALVDGPTRYLDAVRRVAHEPGTFAEVLARLLDAEPAEPVDELLGGSLSEPQRLATVGDELAVRFGEALARIRRTTPFTATEHARAHAFAAAVAELAVARDAADQMAPLPPATGGADTAVLVRIASLAEAGAVSALHARSSADTVRRAHGAPLARVDARLARRLLAGGTGAVVAVVDDRVVGLASLGEVSDAACDLVLLVEDAWQRRGVGTRLLGAAARLAAARGLEEVALRGPADSPGAVALAFGSGLRARVRLAGDELVIRVSTRGLRPLEAVPEAPRAAVPEAPAPA